ncbi:MAG: hypothetical protein NT072_13080 [Deltaproteobacteria bacterium]|nr:hypothetical protein [Deltaproteobacteria bacterium]
MQFKKIFLSLCLICLISACATTEKYEAALNSWVGSDINDLVYSWGYPDSSFDAPNGNKVYMYSQGGSFQMPTTYRTTANVHGYGNTAYGSATTRAYGGQTLNLWCDTYFEVDSSQRIVRWSWEGNRCVSE